MFDEFINKLFNNITLAESLLRNDPSLIYSTNGIGETALHYLAIENKCEEIKWLYNKGANLNAKNDFGDTSLKEAASLGHYDICKFLISMGADHKLKNEDGDTALSDAAINNQIRTVKLLLDLVQPEDVLSDYFDSITYNILLDKNSDSSNALYDKGLH